MDDDILLKQQYERFREKDAADFLRFLDRYSVLLKLAESRGFVGKAAYRVVDAFLLPDPTE